MINNSTNFNKTKESLNSDDQQFTNINKTKESLNSDGQQFTNINKTKESFNSDGELFIITVLTFFCFIYIGRIVDH
jgi:hypothetical protein